MWNLKEAYAKALCLGLAWYSMIQLGVVEGVGKVDGNVPEGWRFDMFVIDDDVDQHQM